jgi:hypothetical protein
MYKGYDSWRCRKPLAIRCNRRREIDAKVAFRVNVTMPAHGDLRAKYLQKKQELAQLEEELRALQRTALLGLPGYVGAASIDALIDLLLPLASSEYRAKFGHSSIAVHKGGRKTRTVITPQLKERVINLLRSGSGTASYIAAQTGVSISYVNKLKAAEALTRRPTRR